MPHLGLVVVYVLVPFCLESFVADTSLVQFILTPIDIDNFHSLSFVDS